MDRVEEIVNRWPKFCELLRMAQDGDEVAWAALETAEVTADIGVRKTFGDMSAMRRTLACNPSSYTTSVLNSRCPTLSLIIAIQTQNWQVGSKLMDIIETKCLPV